MRMSYQSIFVHIVPKNFALGLSFASVQKQRSQSVACYYHSAPKLQTHLGGRLLQPLCIFSWKTQGQMGCEQL